MTCQSKWKDALGDYVAETLSKEESIRLEGHLKECPDCRSDVEQIRLVRKGFAHLADEHIPVGLLLEYHHSGKDSPIWAGQPQWFPERMEAHLSLCGQCQTELKMLEIVREELRGQEKTFEKPAAGRRVFLSARKFWYAVPAAAALLLMVLLNLPVSSKGPNLAVLPFEYSGPAEKESFAEGLVDDISRNFEKVSTVGIISSTSSAQYKRTIKRPRQIGEELGVDYFLTGAIRWDTAGKLAIIKIIPKLIQTNDETEYWTDSFEILDEELCSFPGTVVRQVTAALNVALLEPERRALESCPTGNIQAYEYFVKGNLYFQSRDLPPMQKAAQMYQKAIELDSNFVLAYCMLSRCLTEIFGHYLSNFQAPAKQAADKAIRLQPDLPEVHLALAAYYYHIFEYDSATTHFSIASKGIPNNSDLWEEWGYMQRRQGLWHQAVASLERSLELDPRDIVVNLEIAKSLLLLRDYKKSEYFLNRAIAIAPRGIQPYADKTYLYIIWQGNTEKARKVFRDAPKELGLESYYLCDMIEGNFEKCLWKLTTADTVFERRLDYFMTNASIFGLMKKLQLMKTFYDSALIILHKQASTREGDPEFHLALSRAYAGAGHKEAAIREALKALEMMSVSKNAVLGPTYIQNLAQVYTMVGEHDKAIDQLEYLFSIPSQISPALLRLDPMWAPLRGHPRFQKLINERS